MTKHPGRFRIAASRGVVLSLAFSIPLLGWLFPASAVGVSKPKTPPPAISTFSFAPGTTLDGWMALGLFDAAAEQSTSASLPTVVGSPGTVAPDLERVVWSNGLPYTWATARAGADGRLNVRRVFGPAKRGGVVYLYRGITAQDDTAATLALAASGPLAAWLDGQPLHPPDAADSGGKTPVPQNAHVPRFGRLALHKGVNHLVVRSTTPEPGSAWVVWGHFESGPDDPVVRALPQALAAEGPLDPEYTLPEGWKRFSAKPPGKDAQSVPYLLFVPKTPAPTPGAPAVEQPAAPPPPSTPPADADESAEPEGTPGIPVRRKKQMKFFRTAAGARTPAPTPQQSKAVRKPAIAAKVTESPQSDAGRPLLIVVSPLDVSEGHVLLREPALVVEAERAGWALAAPRLPGALAEPARRAGALEAVRADAAKRAGADARRIALVGLGDAAEEAVVVAFEKPSLYTGVAAVDGRWQGLAPWQNLVLGCAPRPAMFIGEVPNGKAPHPLAEIEADLEDSDGPWRVRAAVPTERAEVWSEMLTFFNAHPREPAPHHVVASGLVSPSLTADWLRVTKAIDSAHPVYLSADCAPPDTLHLQTENVAGLELEMKSVPGLDGRPPIVIEIDYGEREGSQRLNVIYPRMPDRVALELVERTGKRGFWQASEPPASAASQPSGQIGALAADVPAFATPGRAGMDQLLARSVREATDARVALAPAWAARRGQAKGKVTLQDVADWTLDARLSTMSVPSVVFFEVVSRDFAGARLWTTDGLNAIIGGGNDPESEGADEADPEPDAGLRAEGSDAPDGEGIEQRPAAANVPETAGRPNGKVDTEKPPKPTPLALPAAALGKPGAKSSPTAMPGSRPVSPRDDPASATPASIIASSSLSNAGDRIVVAGWRRVLEDLAAECGLEPAAEENASGENAAGKVPLWDMQVGQREALIQYLQGGEPTTPPLFPDIRLLPRKAAVRTKWLRR